MTVQFCIPAPMFEKMTAEGVKELLNGFKNKRFACEITVAAVEAGKETSDFAQSLAKQIREKGSEVAGKHYKEGGMSFKQSKFLYKIAWKNAGLAAALMNGETVAAPEPVVTAEPPVVKELREMLVSAKTPPPLPKKKIKVMIRKASEKKAPARNIFW